MKVGLILTATDKMSGGINSAIGKLGKIAGALGIAGIVDEGLSAVTKYDDAIQSLSAVTGVSGAGLVEMKSEVIDLAKKSRIAAADISAGFENVGSNMSEYLSDPKGLRSITEAGVILSKAARMQVAPALDNLTTIMNQFDLKAKDAAKSVNILTAGEIVGNVRTAQISDALQEFGASASSMNVDLSESVGLIEVLGKKIKSDKIGVAARNLLVTMASAKGLPREALVYLDKYGVSTKKLMDPNTKLAGKLKELSKISGDATAMVKVFGKENITAATVLFNNLPLLEDWTKKIQNTTEAQNQANTNSKSFVNRLAQLKASFGNILISENENIGALGALGDIINYVTNNLSKIMRIVITAGALFMGFKAIMWLAAASVSAYNVALDLYILLSGKSILLMQTNGIVMKGLTMWQGLVTAAQWLWNASLFACPVVWIIGAIIALGAGIYLLVKHWDTVTESLKRFGKFLLSSVLTPIIMVLDAIGRLTGAKWAINLSTKMQSFKNGLDDPGETIASKQRAAAIGVAKTAGATNNSSIVYSPQVTIASGSPADKANFMNMLKDHKRELQQMMTGMDNNKKRVNYSPSF